MKLRGRSIRLLLVVRNDIGFHAVIYAAGQHAALEQVVFGPVWPKAHNAPCPATCHAWNREQFVEAGVVNINQILRGWGGLTGEVPARKSRGPCGGKQQRAGGKNPARQYRADEPLAHASIFAALCMRRQAVPPAHSRFRRSRDNAILSLRSHIRRRPRFGNRGARNFSGGEPSHSINVRQSPLFALTSAFARAKSASSTKTASSSASWLPMRP